MTTERQRLGQLGESIARRYIESLGYRVVSTNERTPHGEIDIVCQLGDAVAFVEVRTRRPSSFGSPEQSISETKAAHMVAAALHYLQQSGDVDREWRIDLVAVELGSDGKLLRVEVIENAIEQ